ncbi:MAG: hypothetical protein LBV74_12255 [Tannerella sp.]|jgi:hypothetical protein|nr:hypothetical protein [Tannerella sp.]
MYHKYIFVFLISLFSIGTYSQAKKKLSRTESFWGLHFDRHSQLTDKHLGASLTEGMVDSLLTMGRPDYIQVDSKGHPGVSSYPTKIGQQVESYEKDPLALIRKVTEKKGVSLYVHHSGVMDMNYVRIHPEEGRRLPDGSPDGQNTSLWRNYADKLLIPQVKELAIRYGIDGVWIDGESWAVYPDYHPLAVKDFKAQTGLAVPLTKDDDHYKEFLEFNRRKFLSYIKHYTNEIHKAAPSFEVCSNWAFSAMMPEPVPEDIGLDFLSGDYDPDNSLNTANWNARCLSGQGLPYDLMAWSFVRPNIPKTALQINQEAASVISLGGGCQVYFRQNEDMSFQPASFGIIKDIADFMLPRREFCKDISIIPQVGLFYSTEGWKESVDDIYRPFGVDDIRGIMDALLDGQQSVEVLMTHHLKEKMSSYPLIVVPEWEKMEDDMVASLKEYVRNGGRLLVIGSSSTRRFEDLLGVSRKKEPVRISLPIGYDERFVVVEGTYREVTCGADTKEMARFYETNDFRYPSGVVATVRKYGKGSIGGIYVDLGKTYLSNTSPVIRDLLADMIAELQPDMMVEVKGSHKVNLVTTSKDNKLLIQLINTSGDHANVKVKGIDEIPVLQDLKITVAMKKKPAYVKVQPEGNELDFSYESGRVNFILPRLEIHSIIEID